MSAVSIAFATGWGCCMVLWGFERKDKVMMLSGAALVVFLTIAAIGAQA